MTAREPALRILRPEWLDAMLARAAPASDVERLRLAIELARENVERGGGPFGALIVDAAGEMAGAGVNLVVPGGSGILHAELIAIVEAHITTGRHRLPAGYTLFTSCEPCAMCLGAVHWSGVEMVVWAATRQDAQAAGFDEGPVFPESHAYLRERGIALESGPLRDEARAVLDRYRERAGAIY